MRARKMKISTKARLRATRPTYQSNTSLSGQLGHRTNDELVKSSDTDFPELGENPEHSGEPEEGAA